jgi:hypothetical protein
MYRITKSQIVTLWVFFYSIAMIMFFDMAKHGGAANLFLELLCVSMLFFLIFYTIGWRNHRKKNQSINDKK